jgi:hypothetical protein
MLVDVYKSNSNPDKYISVPAGTDIAALSIQDLDTDYRQVTVFKKGLELDSTDHRAGLDSAAIMRNIEEHGFAPHTASVMGTIAPD